MKISKQDALTWFRFFAELPEDEDLLPHQQEIAWAVFSQIEEAVDDRFRRLKAQIRGLKTIGGRTFFVGDERRFSAGCRSCLTGTGLSAVRKTNKCDACCKFCYDFGVLDRIPPIGESLWEIGKSHRASMEELRALNGLAEDALPDRRPIIICNR